MKDILVYILQHLVDHPEAIVVEENSQESGVMLRVTADRSDMGKIIGKSGRIIRAIRDLVKIVAAKQGVYADVELTEHSMSESTNVESTNT